VQVVQLTSDAAAGDRVSLKEVLKWFAAHQVTSVMLEGGCTLTSQALREDLVDKVNLFYAPRILGADAVPLVGNMLGQRVNLKQMEVTHFGDDILVQALIHDPWET
jgi:diaminohydroxyphosphoribosylaminopyrimidine deaminase/5-amino-6-(5-phosphoribosylamino)uracil reductase